MQYKNILFLGYSGGQARDEEHLRMSGVQNKDARTYVCMDLQFEN